MITVTLILVAIFAVIVLVGGACMLLNAEGFCGWYFGSQAIKAGFDILAAVVPAILEVITGRES